MEDNPDAPNVPKADNVIPFERAQRFKKAHPTYSSSHDDDELLKGANDKIAEWQANSNLPSLTQVQELFFESICAGASAMARDKIVSAIIAAFGVELGGKRALGSTWNLLAKQFAAECAQAARNNRADTAQEALTPTEKKALRDDLWPKVCELAQAPDLMDRAAGTIHGCCERTRIDCVGLHLRDQSRARSSVECFGKGCQQRRQIIHDDKYVGADRPGLRKPPDE